MSVKISSLNTASTIDSGDDINIAGNNPLTFSDWGGGWFMEDTVWIRSVAGKSLWMGGGLVGANGGLTIGYGGATPPTGGAIIAGNVGIGTSNPGAKLEIEAATAGYASIIRNTTAGGDYLKMIGDSGNTVFEFGSGGTGGDGFLNIYSDNSQKVLINADGASYFNGGNVGIGTTNPDIKFHLQGSNLMATFRNSSTSVDQYTQLEFVAGSRDAYIWLGNQNTTSWAGDGGLNIYTGTGNMDFWTAATQRMRITSGGNVLIGTNTNAGFKLDVNGTARVQGQLVVNHSLSGNYGAVIYNTSATGEGLVVRGGSTGSHTSFVVQPYDGSVALFSVVATGAATFSSSVTAGGDIQSNGIYRDYQGEALLHTSTSAITQIGSTGAGTPRTLAFLAGNAERMRITAAGLVGIGTSTPKSVLDIIGNLSVTHTNASSGYSEVIFYENGSLQADIFVNGTSNTNYAGANSMNIWQGSNAPIAFYTNGTNERMRIAAGGNIYIGHTDDYGARLSVKQPSSGNAANFSNGVDADLTIEITATGAATKYAKLTPSVGIPLVLSTTTGSNVLIGTTTDSGYKLNVNGTARVSGSVYIANTNANNELTFVGTQFTNIFSETTSGIQFGITSTGNTAAIEFLTNNTTKLTIASTGAATFSSSVTAGSFIKSGGTSAQFLKADGSVDSSAYITSAALSGYALVNHTHDLGRYSLAAPANIDALTTTNFRNTLFGNTSNTWNISTARWNTTPTALPGMNSYGTMLAWSGSDTQGFIATDYSAANITVGGGNASNINWTALLIHSSNFGSYALPLTGGNLTGIVISTANIEATAFRTDGNFELTSANTGLKSNFYDTRFYANSVSSWVVSTTAASTGGSLEFRQGFGSTIKGYVYWDASGFGLLNNIGGWSVRTNNGSNYGGTLFGNWVVRSMNVDLGSIIFYTSAGVTKGSVAWDDQGFGLINNQGDYSVLCNQGSSYGGLLRGTWSSIGNFNIIGAELSINSNAVYEYAQITYSSSLDPNSYNWYSGMEYDPTADETYYYIRYIDGNQFRIYPDGTIYVNGGLFSQYSATGNYISVGNYGLYSATYSSYIRTNTTASSYGAWDVTGAKGGYTGFVYNTMNLPHVMFDVSNGNGGLYYQTGSRWVLYYSYGNNSIGIGGTTTDATYKLYVNGNVRVVGTFNLSTLITNGAVYSIGGGLTNTNPSDLRLKEEIAPLQYGLKEVMALNPVTYKWKDGNNGGQRSTGLIAQDVQEIMPDYVKNVSEDSDLLGLDSYAINIVLINAIKELKAEIEILKNK